jgi:hypothetical protein
MLTGIAETDINAVGTDGERLASGQPRHQGRHVRQSASLPNNILPKIEPHYY